MRLLRPAPEPRRRAALVVENGYIAFPMYKAHWKYRRRQLRRKLSLLFINERGQLVMRLFMQTATRPIDGLQVVRNRYLFFA